MADFLDFDDLNMAVNEEAAGETVHPLKQKLTSQMKLAYVGGLAFASMADDGEIQKEEQSAVTCVARSLGVTDGDLGDTFEQVQNLTDKIGYLRENLGLLKERDVFLFFMLDMIKVMAADGVLSANGQKLVDACFKLNKIPNGDETFVRASSAIILKKGNWTEEELAKKLYEEKDDVAKAVCEWFTSLEFIKAREALERKNLQESVNESLLEMRRSMLDIRVRTAFSAFSNALGNSDSSVFFGDDFIPASKRANARESMHVLEAEHILQIDTTVFGSNNEGLVITNRALYYKNSFEDPVRIPWKNLTRSTQDGMYIYFENYGRFACTISDAATAAFAQVLSELVTDLQKEPTSLDVE